MPTFEFRKLVRDDIVNHQVASGARPEYRILSPEEHKKELVRKIIEEAGEILDAGPESVAEEIADVQQALDDLKTKYGLSDDDIAEAQTAKNAKNGAFSKGIYIERVEVPEGDAWVEYYRNNPDRYPEII